MQNGQEVTYLHLDDIIPNRFQPREVFDERALKELAASIKEHGVIQPIIVRQVNNKYEIIAGERRYKASALAGMTKIPAIINNLDDKEAAKVALLENLQRKNLNPIEEARTYQKILELDEMTQETLAKTMGKSQSAVANKLRLLSLTDEVQMALLKENISERHARTLLNEKNPEKQKEMLKRVINEKMSVRTLEEEIKKSNMNENMKNGDVQMNNSNLENSNYAQTQQQNVLNVQQPIIPDINMPSFNDNFLNNQNNKPNLMESPTNDVVNYGEIDEDELDQNENEAGTNIFGPSSASSQVDISKMKNETTDISNIFNNQNQSSSSFNNNSLNTNGEDKQKQKISGDLDSLLNIAPPTSSENNGFNIAKQAINDSEKENNNNQDYFETPDLMSVNLPNSTNNANAIIKNYNNDSNNNNIDNDENMQPNNNLSNIDKTLFQNKKQPQPTKEPKQKSLGMALMEETYNISPKEKAKQYNIHQLVQQIRNTIQQIEKTGAKIDTDEMNFENEYQIVIRIDKNSVN